MESDGAQSKGSMVATEQIYTLLVQAQAVDKSTREQAEATLKQLEKEQCQGFVSSCVQVCKQAEAVDEATRLLAVIVLKNCVGSSWLKLVGSREWLGFNEEEKKYVRSELLPILCFEPSERVAKHVSLLISNIARFDFLATWSDLLDCLLDSSRWHSYTTGSAVHAKARSLRCIKHVVRALNGRTSLVQSPAPSAIAEASEKTKTVRYRCKQLFAPLTSEWAEHVQSAETGRDMLSCKCLQAIAAVISHMDNLDDLQNSVALRTFFERVLQQMQQIHPSHEADFDAKKLRLAAECVFAALDRSPLEFSHYLGPFVTTFMQHMLHLPQDALAKDPARALVLTRFLYRALSERSFKESYVRARDTKAASSSSASQQERVEAVERAKAAFAPLFQDSSVVSTLITRYFVLTQSEIEEWQAESEAQYQPSAAHAGSSDADSPRPCAELLLRAMLERDNETVSNYVIQLAAHAQSKPLSDPQEALYRDVCYRAVGLLGHESIHYIDFNSWYMNELQPMLNINGQEANLLQARVLRARALWLIGCFQSHLDAQARCKWF